MSYNKSYGGQFMGIGGITKAKANEIKETKSAPVSKEKKNAEKVIFSISELKGIDLTEITGDRYFICTVIFDNGDVKQCMENSNHNSSIKLGTFIHSSYSMSFNEEIVLNIPPEANFARCYVSCVTVTEEEGKRNIKLEGLGYTDPFVIQECKVYPYANCKLNTAVGASNTNGILKLCVKCVESSHASTVKSSEPFNVLEEVKKKYDN